MATSDVTPYEPKRPLLSATGLLSVWVFILSLPMWAGRFIASDALNDQYAAGYAFRHWLAEQWKATGRIPLWNPELFGGMPFVGGMHGDIFYPTALLRLIVPTHLGMNLGFVVHYLLAGIFLYLLLRRLGLTWTGAVTGGVAYQLSGVVASLVSPGHDGKLFVTALMPLALLALVMALRERRPEGYGLLALTVGLGILSPHFQMVYYTLIVAGLFSLYLVFGAEDRPAPAVASGRLGLALAAVIVGFGIGAIQLLPFYHYVPFSPRAESYGGFAEATSWAIPWSHVPEFFLAGFTGTSFGGDTYWGANFAKLHSEYLGLPVVALALFGLRSAGRRRIAWWLGGIGLLFLLVALGSATPFYQLWWSVMPFVKQTRAPGMAFFVVAFVVATFAAFGVERIEKGEGKDGRWWMGIGGGIALLALVGVIGAFAASLAEGIELARIRPTRDAVQAAQGAIRVGALWSGVALAVLGGLLWLRRNGRVPVAAFAIGVVVVVGADLWRAAGGFWRWSESPEVGLYGGDGVTRYLQQQPLPYRVMDLSDQVSVYPGSSLMAFGIPQVLGHHGNQLHAFNELLGGKNQWTNLLRSRRLWDLFAAQYVLLPAGLDIGSAYPAWINLAADYDTVFSAVMTASGRPAHVLERRVTLPWARLVPAAAAIPDDRAIPLVADPRSPLEFGQVVLVPPDAPVDVDSLAAIPEALPNDVVVEEWAPGQMRLRIEPAHDAPTWLMISENWYPGWQATVDGREAIVVRGDVSLLTVRVPAGGREVALTFESADYRTGKRITLASLVFVALVFAVPPVLRRRRG